MNTRERAARNEAIVRAKLEGASCREVAGRYGLSTRQVRRVWSDGVGSRSDDELVAALLGDLLDQSAVLRDLRDETERAPASRKLGLVRESTKVLSARTDLLRLLGPLA